MDKFKELLNKRIVELSKCSQELQKQASILDAQMNECKYLLFLYENINRDSSEESTSVCFK